MSNKSSNSKNETHDDFWDLGDDDLNREVSGEAPKEEGKEDGDKLIEDPPKKKKSEKANIDELGDLDDDPFEEKAIEERPAPPTKPKLVGINESRKEATTVSTVEKISLIAVIACLVGAFAWGISFFYRDAPEGELVKFIEDFPIKGEDVTIETVETWWRKPVRSGDEPDVGVVIDSNLIPCARIKLSEGGSTTLQVSFRDGDQNLIGDTHNLSVVNGKFSSDDSDEIVVRSTSGFNNPSRIHAYANEDFAPWSLVIIESHDIDSDSDPLVKARISASSKDN
jgi:hypothetical protein|tara:strand:+ start:155 stop:1000 length:846 start_codon:yes stop_codon:yes gene_type:complete